MTTQNKTYAIEVTEEEAEGIEREAAKQGVSASEYIVHWIRTLFFGFNHAVEKLSETGHVGNPWDKKD